MDPDGPKVTAYFPSLLSFFPFAAKRKKVK